jgi:hypothetical protein
LRNRDATNRCARAMRVQAQIRKMLSFWLSPV